MMREGEKVEPQEMFGKYPMEEQCIVEFSPDKTRVFISVQAEVRQGGKRVGFIYVPDICVRAEDFRWTDVGFIEDTAEEATA